VLAMETRNKTPTMLLIEVVDVANKNEDEHSPIS
jgi:hypothetical protein